MVAPYEFLSRDEIENVAHCAALGTYEPRTRHFFGLSFMAVAPAISLMVCGIAFRLTRRRLLRRLRRAHGGASFDWPGLLAEVRRRDRNTSFRTW
ncbi:MULTISPECIES: hypothetical protein [unclassified Streptomyces]|uniref:hypothetical protein n=1 Tax=unclassified Streptomyces TaxID=2593676 RepID=UPI0033B9937F